jgi:type I restriction enzyme M protein
VATHTKQVVDKLWNYCNLLRDDGLSYGDYVEQLTYLLFLKMADERTDPPWLERSFIPEGLDWDSLVTLDGSELEAHYRHVLESLAREPGMLGTIFQKSQNKISDPAKLRRLVAELIDKERWLSLDTDTKGDAYEGLLERNAQDTKGGAGQYFTPRPLIDAIVDCIRPQPGETIHDPAAGTAGFLLSAHRSISQNHALDRDEQRHLRLDALRGTELVPGVARLAAMNLMLHGVGPLKADEGDSPIAVNDSLLSRGGDRYDVVLTNPPFGRKSSVLVVGDDGEQSRDALSIVRDDFIATTSNKQLNFLQHVKSILKVDGRAAVVVPDNVLFEGGAGEVIRRDLLKTADVHTLLRLPTGIFYAQGVKANVLFFDVREGGEGHATRKLWIYDLRTNRHFTLKTKPLGRSDLDEFVACYHPENREDRVETWSEDTPDGRWRCYDYEELVARDKANLDIFWLRDESLDDAASLEDPDVIAADIIEDLQTALEEMSLIYADLAGPAGHSETT